MSRLAPIIGLIRTGFLHALALLPGIAMLVRFRLPIAADTQRQLDHGKFERSTAMPHNGVAATQAPYLSYLTCRGVPTSGRGNSGCTRGGVEERQRMPLTQAGATHLSRPPRI